VSGQGDEAALVDAVYRWIQVGALDVQVRFASTGSRPSWCCGDGDRSSSTSIPSATCTTTPTAPAYFVYLNLFVTAMLILCSLDNLLVLFVGWEGVGLCSYLLIGFWYRETANADAGKKAFLVNRIGDAGFLLGCSCWCKTVGTLHIASIEHQAATLAAPRSAAGRCRSWWACCSSSAPPASPAQIPLYVWLPDAMAGPTPVAR
jgi:NADH-quinone oxidoreductase subunit L